MSQLLKPSELLSDKTTSFPSLSAPFQESEVIDKIDNDGHHYLKVLLLSNKKTRNNWIAPYKRIGDLPKELIDSFIGLPRITEHDYQYFDKLQAQLFNQGKSDEEILAILKEESRKKSPDYIDHVFTDDPNSGLLYGQLKVMDPKENKYIEKYGKPSKNYTSPAMYGVYQVHDDGTMVYDVNTMRPFHVAGVDVPAFPEQEAKIKGVCAGSSDTCKKALAYAGFDSSTVTSNTTPTENLNSTCGCNKNIQDMSTNINQQPPIVTPVATPVAETAVGTLLKDSQNTTQEAIEAARKEAERVVKESQKQPKQEKKEEGEQDDEGQEEEKSLKLELRKYKQIAEEERKRSLDQYNFFLDEILSVHIPQSHFKKEEDFNNEKENMKSFINKYNINLQDAKWLIIKTAKGIPNQNEENNGNNKKEGKHGVGVAGLLSSPGTTYNPEYITKPVQQSVPKPGGSHLEDDDFPLGIE